MKWTEYIKYITLPRWGHNVGLITHDGVYALAVFRESKYCRMWLEKLNPRGPMVTVVHSDPVEHLQLLDPR